MGNEAWPSVPHLTTALTGPLQELESQLLANQVTIEHWFRQRFHDTPAPFYCSVDLRNSGFKLAPVDTNLFPAGFNNLNPAFQPLAIQAVQSAVEHVCPTARSMLLVPENHTRNVYYLENLAALAEVLTRAGLRLRIGSLLPELAEPKTFPLPSGRMLTLEPITRRGAKLHVGDDFEPCTILLNNDLSAGCPPLLENLDQPVIPHLGLGWWNRHKSTHFGHYREVARSFAQMLGLDPWLIEPSFRRCGKVDFQKREGEDCLARHVEDVLGEIAAKYAEYGIKQDPFVILKSDSGTYGMGIMTAKSPDDVRALNRKQRAKMAYGKEGHTVSEVMVQEGVYTFETWGAKNAVAEPVVYMIDHYVVGGFYRVHTQRRHDENLNAPGMHFEPLAFAETGAYPDPAVEPDAVPNRFYAFGVVARLALLAAAREAKDVASNESGVMSQAV